MIVLAGQVGTRHLPGLLVSGSLHGCSVGKPHWPLDPGLACNSCEKWTSTSTAEVRGALAASPPGLTSKSVDCNRLGRTPLLTWFAIRLCLKNT